MNNIIYKMCSSCFLTSGLVRKIEQRVYILYPSTKNSVIKRTERYLKKMIILALSVTIMLMIFAELSFYYTCLVGVLVYVIANSYVNTSLLKQELKLISMFEEFITEVHFRYQFEENVLKAIEDAINKVPYEMAVHGEMILAYLKKAYKGEGDDYREISPDSLFLTFYSLSLTVLSYGDKSVESGSLYLKNLGYLKEDINVEILKRRKLEGQFIGLFGVTLIPVFFIKVIEKWALSNMPDLYDYYNGVSGILTTLALSFLTIGIYKFIAYLRNPKKPLEYKSRWTEKLLENDNIKYLVIKIIKINYKKSERINVLLKSVKYPYEIKEFVLRRIIFTGISMILSLMVFASIGMGIVFCLTGAVGVAVITYNIILIQIIVKRKIMLLNSEEEIVRFQSVILMLMHMDRITVYEILKEIDNFAIVFKEDVEKMINSYSYKGMKVFEEAKENTGFMPFEKLLDNFLAVDLLGVKNAFYNMETERRYYVEKHKTENEEIIAKKAAIAKVIAFVPICLVIILKLILPFVVEGMAQLSNAGL